MQLVTILQVFTLNKFCKVWWHTSVYYTCKINYVSMQHDYVKMRITYLNMQNIYVDMQQNVSGP